MALLTSRVKRPQLKFRPRTFEQGKSKTIPAPYGGLNLRDDISALKPNEARVLENWLPTTGQLSIRPGFDEHARGLGVGEVKTLAAFVGYTSSKMLGGANGTIYDATSATYPDGNDTYTNVLLPFNGADTSTSIGDFNVGGSAHTWAVAGNAQIDTAQSKFGGASLLLDGTGDWVTTADHADFNLAALDWTVDFWFNCNEASGTLRHICGQSDSSATATTVSFYLSRTTGNVIQAVAAVGGSTFTVTGTTQFTDAVNTGWHHAAFVRTGDILRLFIDGTQEGGDVAITGTVNDSANALRVGALGEVTTNPWLGWIDEWRLSVGTARWTAAFTPPTVPHSPLVLKSTGITQDRWQTAMTANRLFFVNGADTPQVYDGSTVANIAWAGSGLTNTNLVNIALVRNRLWFCENISADVWYGDVGQITAASNLTKFQLSQIAGGGICMATHSWSKDAGDGADDFTVFMMSTGEVIIYQGDPSTTFSLIGKYQIAPPIGRQCLFKIGGELVVITRQGLVPISSAVGDHQTGSDIARLDPWGKIAPGVVTDAASYASNGGWHGCLHEGVLYLNVPKTVGAISMQRVLQTRNGAWTDYTNYNCSAMCSFEGDLYWGSQTGGKVLKQTGVTDDGANIVASSAGAFVYPTSAQNNNVFTAARPKMQGTGSVAGLIGVDVDFVIRSLSGTSVNLIDTGSSVSAWGGAWDTTPWGIESASENKWFTVRGEGKAVSVRLRVLSSSSQLDWFNTDILYKPGGIR